MNRRQLASYLRALALASAPALLAACPAIFGCPDRQSTIEVTPDGGYTGPVLDGGVLPKDACEAVCTESYTGFKPGTMSCAIGRELDGGLGRSVDCTGVVYCIGGRRTAGLAEAAAQGATAVGRHFARMAHLEAASVPAFARLVDELRTHGAPARLVAGARAAIADERRHARVIGALARRYGGEPPAVELEALAPRALVEVARENAVEGCVGETWGAVVAYHQAAHAADARVRAALARVADDEARHAELAWAIAAWAEPLLSSRERAAIAAARREAALRIIDGYDRAPDHPTDDDAALVDEAGLPSRERALALLVALRSSMWA